jgi:acyl-coenzyme A thioesterase 13
MDNQIYVQLKKLEGEFFTYSQSMAGRWLNYKLLMVKPGYIEASIEVRKEMTNPSQNLHGGMIAMISDELCGLAFYSLGYKTFYTTVNLTVDYLYSAPIGSTVIAKANVMRSGKKIANIECYIYDVDDNIIAHAKSNLVNTDKEVFNLTVHHS